MGARLAARRVARLKTLAALIRWRGPQPGSTVTLGRPVTHLHPPQKSPSVRFADRNRIVRHPVRIWDAMETLYYSRHASLAGPLAVAVSEKGLVTLEFDRGQFPPKKSQNIVWRESEKKTKAYARELREYFEGKRREFSFPLDLRGTPFQLKCWRALLNIPYGETRTYADIARVVGQPQAFRAVGMANNRNPIAIVVPCHRVIASDGTLCGYGGGLDVKRKLLDLEGALTRILAA